MVNDGSMEDMTLELYSKGQVCDLLRLKEEKKTVQTEEKKHERKWNKHCAFEGH